MDLARFLPFLAVAVVLVVTPGPDFAVTTRNVLRGGQRAGVWTAVGVASGAAIWTVAAILGLAAVLRVSADAFSAVKIAGALYLLWLGGKSLLAALRSGQPDSDGPMAQQGPASSSQSRRDAYRQGFLCNVLNPKAAVIFTSVLPQFVNVHDAAAPQLAILGATMVVLIGVWLTVYASVAARTVMLTGARFRQTVDAITGVVLVAFGLKLATE